MKQRQKLSMLVALMLVAALALVACTGSTTKEETTIPGLTYKVPAQWAQAAVTQTEFGAGGEFSQGYRFAEKGEAFLTFGANHENYTGMETVEAAQKAMDPAKVKDSEVEALKVDGKEAGKISVTTSKDDVEWYTEMVVVVFEGHTIRILVRSLATDKAAVSSGMNSIVKSMKIADLSTLTEATESTESTQSTESTESTESTQAPQTQNP